MERAEKFSVALAREILIGLPPRFPGFLLSANWFIGFTGLSAYGLIIVKRTPKEERMMVSRFGEEYIAYMKRPGRFLPRLKYRP